MKDALLNLLKTYNLFEFLGIYNFGAQCRLPFGKYFSISFHLLTTRK